MPSNQDIWKLKHMIDKVADDLRQTVEEFDRRCDALEKWLADNPDNIIHEVEQGEPPKTEEPAEAPNAGENRSRPKALAGL